MSRTRWLFLVPALGLVSSCADSVAEPSVVATAVGLEWTVDDAVGLVAPDAELPASEEVVRTLANLWADYVVLAVAAAEDSTLAVVDMTPVVQELVEQEMILALRAAAVEVDTTIAQAELRERYAREAPGSLVRARHILLAWPRNPTESQRDSVYRAIEEIRNRIMEGGEDFATLASELSQDPVTAAQGGDTGFFRRGQMVRSFEDAAFALEAGQVSPPVESPYGLHLIKVEERQTPSIESFRIQLIDRRAAVAESTFVAGLEDVARPQMNPSAYEVVRALALNPRVRLSPQEEDWTLVSYLGGRVTEGELLRFLRSEAPESRNRIAQAQDRATAENLLRGLTRRELLLWEAGRRGISVAGEQRVALAGAARRNLVEAASQLGLYPIAVRPQQERSAAIKEAVGNLLSGMLSGERREITPLGAMVYILRDQYPSEISEAGLERAVSAIREARGAR